MPRTEVGDDAVYAANARGARGHARQSLQPAHPVAVRAGEAVTWENQADERDAGDHAWLIETLEHPTSISVGASGQRMSAALAADVLEPAVDAAASAQAANSLEKMLCHQLAAVHFAAMRLLEQSATPRLPPREVARLTNAAARLIDAYQSGCLTLQKLKTKGMQRVVVQHQQVHVGDGGQAVVAGRIEGGRGGEGEQKMADEVHEQRRGWLKHGNPPGDWMAAPRCGALTRRKTPCQCPAMRGRRRCRLHGGKSTGPTTATGLARSRRARWKHGAYSREMREMRARVRRSQEDLRALDARGKALGLW